MAKKIDYNARNFSDVRQQLVEFIKKYYPETFSDFNDASVGMMLLELNAAVGDMLSFHTDRMFNETQINYAQERSSLLELARTFGLNVPGKRPSITIVDWTVTKRPVKGDTFDESYAPKILTPPPLRPPAYEICGGYPQRVISKIITKTATPTDKYSLVVCLKSLPIKCCCERPKAT